MSTALYVHLPFCRAHCTYCAFAISTDLSLQDRYVDALLREVDARSTGAAVDSLYFGGGTPSRTSIANLGRLTDRIATRFAVSGDVEFSIEANPEDITPDSLAAWRSFGVNRISIGVQSFHDAELLPLGRMHGEAGAREAVELTVATGVRTNLDLILGLPGQSEVSFRETLEIATRLGPGHVSLYMLDLEERSPLRVQLDRGRVNLPEEDLVTSLYVAAIDRLAAAGLRQYEISNFARSGEECRHNLRYWSRLPYVGLGLGAHSFDGTRRFANTRHITAYVDNAPDVVDFSEPIGSDESRRETLFLRLRQTSGIDYAEIERLCGMEGTEWVDRGLRDGWLRRSGGQVAFTPSGFLLSNEYISQLF